MVFPQTLSVPQLSFLCPQRWFSQIIINNIALFPPFFYSFSTSLSPFCSMYPPFCIVRIFLFQLPVISETFSFVSQDNSRIRRKECIISWNIRIVLIVVLHLVEAPMFKVWSSLLLQLKVVKGPFHVIMKYLLFFSFE